MGDSGISDGGEGAAGTSAAGMAQQRRARKVENELKRTRERYERGELPSKLPDQGKGNISRAEKLRLDVDRVPQARYAKHAHLTPAAHRYFSRASCSQRHASRPCSRAIRRRETCRC